MADSKKDAIQRLQLDINQVSRAKSVLNQNQIQKIFNSTPAKYKYTRPAKGGGNWTYIKSSYVRKVLDGVFGFNWNFEIETSLAEAFEIAKLTKVCVVKGTLTGKVHMDGQWLEISKTQFGRSEVKFKKELEDGHKVPLDFGNDMKAATSDCLKKCASLFGIGADVYEADEFMEIEIIGSLENSDRTKQTEQRIKQAKKALEAQGTEVADDKN